MFPFSSRSPFAPLNQGPSQVLQPDFYSLELIVVSESSIAEGAVCLSTGCTFFSVRRAIGYDVLSSLFMSVI